MTKTLFTYFIIGFISVVLLSMESVADFTDKPGARPAGLGGSFVAIADDINSLYYNPAGLGRLKRTEITALYDQQNIGLGFNMNYGYIGAVQMVGELGTFGLSGSQSYVDLYSENVLALAFGTKITKNPLIYFGGAVNWLYKNYVENEYTRVDPFFANGYSSSIVSYDIGALLFVNNKLSLGLAVKNMGLNPSNNIGCAYKLGDLTAVLELNWGNYKINGNQDLNFLAGAEYKLNEDFFLRTGGNLNNINLGTSFNVSDNLQVDYAFRYPITGIESTIGSHMIQLSYKLGSSKREQPLTKVIISLPSGMDKMSMAVLDLEANNTPQSIASVVSEYLRLEFYKTKRYDVVERKNLDKVLKEQQLQLSGCTTAECAVEIGKILNVHYIIVGSLNKLGNQYSIQARLVDIEKAKVVLADISESDSEEKLPESIKELVQRINSQISIVGKIVKIDGDIITIDKGSSDNIETGMEFGVEKDTEEKKEEIAIIRIEYVDQNNSKGKIIRKIKEIQEGDIINLGNME